MKKTIIAVILYFVISLSAVAQRNYKKLADSLRYIEQVPYIGNCGGGHYVLQKATLQAQKSEKSLENMIIKTTKAYFNKDEQTLNSFIHKDFGIALLYRRGAVDNVSMSEKISFDNPIPEYLPYDIYFEPDYTIRFEGLPVFDCDDFKWNKPSGIYCDTVNIDKTLSRVAKFEKEHLLADWTDNDIKKFEEIESKSHKVIAIGKIDGESAGEFIFYLMSIKDKWYLAAIDRFEACSA